VTLDRAERSGDAPASRRARVLIAEDEQHLGMLLEHYLIGRGHDVTLVTDGRAALERLRAESFDVALLDVQMPKVDGLAVLRAVRESPLPPEVIVMTGNGTVDVAITAMQHGAYDYLAKPYRMAEVELLVTRAAERRRLAREAFAAGVRRRHDPLLTGYAPLRAVLDAVERAAPALHGMLVVGEPGTGREALARRAHRAAGGEVFVSGALPNDSRLSALLAGSARGTLFLGRVEALPRDTQHALADVLERPDVDGGVRVIASSARDAASLGILPALAARLETIVVELPPLRDRVGDVPLLTDAALRRFGGSAPTVVTHAAVERLERHRWPGNVPELRVVLERAAARAGDGVMDVVHLGLP
jgi:two-component system response regulator AtoC